MEYFEISFRYNDNVLQALVVKQQVPEEIIYHVYIDADISPLNNLQLFSFVDGAFNESLPDQLEETPLLRSVIWKEILARGK